MHSETFGYVQFIYVLAKATLPQRYIAEAGTPGLPEFNPPGWLKILNKQ